MAAPEHVPVDRTRLLRTYESPPRRAGSWVATRPGEVVEGQPHGDRFGSPGPDQGYVLTLVKRFEGKLELTAGEHERDALAGAAAVALKRASLFGRAPVVHDLTVALTTWGFLDDGAPPELVKLRKKLFEEVAHHHHYPEQRRIVDLVPDEVLQQTPQQVTEAHRADWRSVLDVSKLEPTA